MASASHSYLSLPTKHTNTTHSLRCVPRRGPHPREDQLLSGTAGITSSLQHPTRRLNLSIYLPGFCERRWPTRTFAKENPPSLFPLPLLQRSPAFSAALSWDSTVHRKGFWAVTLRPRFVRLPCPASHMHDVQKVRRKGTWMPFCGLRITASAGVGGLFLGCFLLLINCSVCPTRSSFRVPFQYRESLSPRGYGARLGAVGPLPCGHVRGLLVLSLLPFRSGVSLLGNSFSQ